MESGNGSASSKGVLVPVSESSDVFQNSILAPLKSAYLYEESKQSFRYKSAVLVNNPALEEKYNAFRAKRREAGYSEEDLKESYGFLLFDDVNKANALGETGVLTGNSTCTTLGDPSKGVYISMYSDCLDLNRWYHGKSGYIAIIRLTKGRVKKVLENYTQNFTAPSVGFDCHVSEHLPSVSDKTSSFLAFERTQYYVYELLDDGSDGTVQSPSAACPFAVVSFSYTDTKATVVAPQEKSEEKKQVCHYLPWRGQLQIGTQSYDVGLRSTAGALIPAELPPVVKVDRVISMLDLRQLLPRAVFETCFSGEVFLDGLYFSLCEIVSSEAEETNPLSLLLGEIKEKDVALTIPLNDGGFLILLHSSHFLTYDDTWSSATEVLQGVFVFRDSRAAQRDTKCGHRKPAISSEILRVLPVLSYAEGEVEKTPIDPSEELCEVLAQHMQTYAALINPGLALSPSREVSIFPDHYDVLDAHKHLYSSPEWTNKGWQSLRTYLSKPVSFQLPVSKASEILMAGQEERIEDLDDDVYICLSSPEEAPANPVGMGSEDQLTGQKSPVNVDTSVDSCKATVEAPVDLRDMSQNVVPRDLQAGDSNKDTERSDLRVLLKTGDMGTKHLAPSTSDELPAELIVSITSAERTVPDESVIRTESATKHKDFELSGFSTAKLQTAGVSSLNDETVKTKKHSSCPQVTNLKKTKHGKPGRAHSKRWKKVSKACDETPSLQPVKIPVEDDNLKSQMEDQPKESADHPQLNSPSNIDWRKVRRRKRKFGKLSTRNKKVRASTVGQAISEDKKPDPGHQSLESTILMELEACPLRKKMVRWDLKPVISECGRILVPHGSVDIVLKIKSVKDKLQATNVVQCPEKTLVVGSVNNTVKMEQKTSTAPETAVDEISKDGENHPQNASVHHVNLEHSILRQSGADDGLLTLNPESSEHSSENVDTGTSPLDVVQEKHTDTLSTGKCATKGEFLLSKLKSVLLRGKRKNSLLMPEEMAEGDAQYTEPCLKMSKVDSDTGMLKSNDAQDTNVGVKDVSKMLSVDPLFAYALGLTPKETQEKGQTTQQRKNSQEQTIFDKQPQILQRPPSIFPRRGRIKTLKKHQGISAEYVKKKWWLHFQTPACYASEKLKYKENTRDNSVRKTVKEKMNSSCSSTDALNLLADLALSASNDQVPPQPAPALESKPETSLKKCDLTKDVSSAEQESVLHALLRQPASRPIQPLESPSPSHLVGGSELVGLVSKEHAYSLPPSSSLLLGLPGTPFQVSPLSGSTRLLHHHQTMYGDGNIPLHTSVVQEDKSEQNHRTPEYLKKHMVRRRKFRHSRTFVNKDGSVQVTKQWKENYDFSRDSKFTSHSKDKAIIRALHGPWDFSVQDTSEEVRLIVHMWIGLFYSRSTARFFDVDSNLNLCPQESDSLEMSSGMVSPSAQSELKANSFAPFPSVTDTSDPSLSKALDLSKKDDLDQGPEILDLSLRNSNAEIVTSDQVNSQETSVIGERKEASETLNTQSSVGLQEASPSQCYRKTEHSTENVSEMDNVRSTHENKRTLTPSQKAGQIEHNDVRTCKDDGTFGPVQEEMESVSSQQDNNQTASTIGKELHGCNNEKADKKNGTENSEATEMSLVPQHGKHSSKPMTDDEVGSNKEAGDVVPTVDHICVHGPTQIPFISETTYPETVLPKDGETLEVKETSCEEGSVELSPKMTQKGDDSTNSESDTVCKGNLLKFEKPLYSEGPKAVSPGKAENVNEDEDCCTENKLIQDDSFGKQDRHDEEDRCVSAVEANSEVSDQLLPVTCEGPETLDAQLLQANNEEETCHDLHLRKLCANGGALTGEDVISEKALHAPTETEATSNEPAVEENQSIETGSQNKVLANVEVSSDDHEDLDTKSVEGEQKVDNTTEKEQFHQPHSPQCEPIKRCEAEVASTKETDLESDKTNGFKKIHSGVVIPFIGIDTSGEDIIQPHDAYSKGNVEEVVCCQTQIPFISETTCPETVLPTQVYCRSHMSSKNAELSSGKISLLDISKTNQPEDSGSDSDDRCPTPTLDEKPYESLNCSGPSNSRTSAFSHSETCKNTTNKYVRHSISMKNKLPLERKPCQKSTVHRDPDLELRTLRVLQSIDKLLSKSSPIVKSSQVETADRKQFLDQAPKPTFKYIPTCLTPSHSSADFKDQTISYIKPAVVSASTSQELHTESSGHFRISPFKSKLEEVLGVRLQLKKTDSSVHQCYFKRTDKLQETTIGQDCHPHKVYPSTESLQAIKPNNDQDSDQKPSQISLSHESRSYTQRPIMAVKPSKCDESQADCISKVLQSENSVMSNSSKNKETKSPLFTYSTSTPMLLEKETESFKGNAKRLSDDKHEAGELSSKTSWLSDVRDSKSSSDKARFAHLDPYQYERSDISKFNNIPSSSLPIQSFESAKSSAKLVERNQELLTNSLVEQVCQTTKESIEIDQQDYSDASTSRTDHKDDGINDGSLFLVPQSSLTCTVYNTGRKRSYSFLEQISQRCLQDDLTEASMEQECLIFSEQMRQLLKRSKRGSIHQLDSHDRLNLSCTSPVTVHFSCLEEQEDSVDCLDAPSLVGQKIKVDMSDRKGQTNTTEEEKTLHPQKSSQVTGTPIEHAGVSSETAECARMYEAMMDDVCAVRKVPSRPKHFRMDRGYPKTEPSNHFDFCDQMKRKMDESFRSNLNSVVKKSCKTKYRFYILVMSDDPFFEEAKAQMEAEGHTAVQPSEFFLGDSSSSSLLIILRNEDIAEHICEVPHLLELKKTPGVQFAGIDEPDDVVNLTHQELFTRGGFIMFDRAALETLSLCNMKKMSENLQELSRTGKWKWMLHYRDSRRLKENARLSAEAKEKKHFLNWCQEAGMLEVLPYHECDLVSRDQPDYLTCLVRLQVQNISARYPVFITDKTTDSAFGSNGILTVTFDSFLTCSPSETFTV